MIVLLSTLYVYYDQTPTSLFLSLLSLSPFSFILSLRTITNLTSRMERLEAEHESAKSLRLRHSTNRKPTDRGDITPRYGRKDHQTSVSVDQRRWSGESVSSVASSIFENHHKVPFIWQMPFTVKCIGTFRSV